MSVERTMADERGGRRSTAMVLAALALAFFAAIVVKTWLVGR